MDIEHFNIFCDMFPCPPAWRADKDGSLLYATLISLKNSRKGPPEKKNYNEYWSRQLFAKFVVNDSAIPEVLDSGHIARIDALKKLVKPKFLHPTQALDDFRIRLGLKHVRYEGVDDPVLQTHLFAHFYNNRNLTFLNIQDKLDNFNTEITEFGLAGLPELLNKIKDIAKKYKDACVEELNRRENLKSGFVAEIDTTVPYHIKQLMQMSIEFPAGKKRDTFHGKILHLGIIYNLFKQKQVALKIEIDKIELSEKKLEKERLRAEKRKKAKLENERLRVEKLEEKRLREEKLDAQVSPEKVGKKERAAQEKQSRTAQAAKDKAQAAKDRQTMDALRDAQAPQAGGSAARNQKEIALEQKEAKALKNKLKKQRKQEAKRLAKRLEAEEQQVYVQLKALVITNKSKSKFDAKQEETFDEAKEIWKDFFLAFTQPDKKHGKLKEWWCPTDDFFVTVNVFQLLDNPKSKYNKYFMLVTSGNSLIFCEKFTKREGDDVYEPEGEFTLFDLHNAVDIRFRTLDVNKWSHKDNVRELYHDRYPGDTPHEEFLQHFDLFFSFKRSIKLQYVANIFKGDMQVPFSIVEVETDGDNDMVTSDNDMVTTKPKKEIKVKEDYEGYEETLDYEPLFIVMKKKGTLYNFHSNVYSQEGTFMTSHNLVDTSFQLNRIESSPFFFLKEGTIKVKYGDVKMYFKGEFKLYDEEGKMMVDYIIFIGVISITKTNNTTRMHTIDSVSGTFKIPILEEKDIIMSNGFSWSIAESHNWEKYERQEKEKREDHKETGSLDYREKITLVF